MTYTPMKLAHHSLLAHGVLRCYILLFVQPSYEFQRLKSTGAGEKQAVPVTTNGR